MHMSFPDYIGSTKFYNYKDIENRSVSVEIKHIPIIGLFSVRIFQSSNSVHLEEILHHQTDGWNPLNHGINNL